MAVDPILIVVPIIIMFVVIFFNYSIINYYMDPMDKHMAYFQKIIVIVGLTFSEAVILLLPLDVANRGGLVGCGTWNTLCGGLPMEQIWEAVFIIVIVLTVVIIPYAIFYYESDDGMSTQTWKARHCEAFKYTACLLVIVVAFIGILFGVFIYVLNWQSHIPVTQIAVNLNKTGVDQFNNVFTTYTLATVNGTVQPMSLLLTAPVHYCTDSGQLCSSNPNGSVKMSVSLVIFVIALFGFIGWFLFAVYGGIGLFALPVDMINAFIHRPAYMSAGKYADCRKALDKRLVELLEIGEKIEEELARTATLSRSEKRKARANDRQTVNKYKQAVYFIEKDYEDLRLCHKEYSKYNPLIPFFQLLGGIVAIIISILFLLQIALYIIPIQYTGLPLTKLLCDMFNWFDSFFSLLGTISVAIFCMYLLFAVMKGTFKFGMRFFLLPIHPMKPGGTLMNSFLFNLVLILLCAIPCCQFCSQAFRDYTRLTDIDVIFTGQIQYMDGFKYFYEYNAFIYGMVFFALATVCWLIMCPGDDKIPENELRAMMLADEDKERKKKDREAERAKKYGRSP